MVRKKANNNGQGNNLVSVCLLSYKRAGNIQAIINSFHHYDFIDEILVWNNQPTQKLSLKGEKVKIIDSPENTICYGRFLCAKRARNEIIYVQDDDVLVNNMVSLYEEFLKDSSQITFGLSKGHYQKREQYSHFYGQVAYLGWGAFFKKSWVPVLDRFLSENDKDYLFHREADQIFSLLLRRKHKPVLASIHHLNTHNSKGIALYRQTDHYLLRALAVRKTLAFNREKNDHEAPVTWNVVIPCKNYGRFLGEAVGSVMQNNADYVITIVDDHSTDNTAALGKQLEEKYAFIRYIRLNEPRGVSYARNKGISTCKSLFVILLDADDKIGSRYLPEAEKLLRNGCDVANPDAILFGKRKARWEVPQTVSLNMLLKKNHVHTCAAFRRSFWERVGGIDEQMENWQDYEFWIRLARAGGRIEKLPGDHFFYRKHGLSKSSITKANRHQIRKYIQNKHEALFAALHQ